MSDEFLSRPEMAPEPGAHGGRGLPAAEERLEELFDRYARLIRSAAIRVGGVEAAQCSDDVVQTVLTEVWNQLRREQTIHHPASYLYRAAVRATVRVLKQQRGHLDSNPDLASEAPPQVLSTPQQIAESREVRMQIAHEVDALDSNRRRAVRAHLAGFDVREIMSMYGWSYNKARNLVARGMGDLRVRLRERGLHA